MALAQFGATLLACIAAPIGGGGFCSGSFVGFVNLGCGLSRGASQESLVGTARPWIGGGLAPGSA